MIHVFKCNVCGVNFRKKDIETAIANNDTDIECPSCRSLIRFNAADDAYLGAALSQFRIQTVFKDDKAAICKEHYATVVFANY